MDIIFSTFKNKKHKFYQLFNWEKICHPLPVSNLAESHRSAGFEGAKIHILFI
jgi:hypothetical protein